MILPGCPKKGGLGKVYNCSLLKTTYYDNLASICSQQVWRDKFEETRSALVVLGKYSSLYDCACLDVNNMTSVLFSDGSLRTNADFYI